MNSWKGIFPIKGNTRNFGHADNSLDNLKELYEEAALEDEQAGNGSATNPFGI